MAAKGKRPMRALTASDKIEAIQRVNDGESKASVARDIGVPESTLRGWCKNEDKLRYMSSRQSTPDTDKALDAPLEKRIKYESLCEDNGLDLSGVIDKEKHDDGDMSKTKADLSRFNTELLNNLISKEKPAKQPDLGAAMSMSAISPLSHLSLAHGNLGLSFNEIATNLSLIAQLNPNLTSLSNTISGAKALRSIRSSKPSSSHAVSTATTSSSKQYKTHYGDALWAAKYPKEPPVDDVFWYWLKTQQAMMDFTTARSSTQPQPQLQPQPVKETLKPVTESLNKDSWFWQYYKQFGGDVTAAAAAAPLEQPSAPPQEQAVEIAPPPPPVPEPVPEPEPEDELAKNQSKARTVLDNLLFNNNSSADAAETAKTTAPDAEQQRDNTENECEVAEALDHGDKFLKWLESCQDPSVTRMQVFQLKALLGNIRTRAERKTAQTANPKSDRVSRRK